MPHLLPGHVPATSSATRCGASASSRRRASPPRRDGLVGLGCGTGQQWLDVCAMVGHPEWTEDRKLLPRPHRARTDDRRVGRRAHRRRGAPTWRPRSASRTRRSSTAPTRPTIDHFVRARRVRRQPARRGRATRSAVPAVVGRPAAAADRRRRSASTPPTPLPAPTPTANAGVRHRAFHAAVRGAAGARHDGVLGGSARRPHPRAARRRGDPPRVGEAAGRRSPRRRRAADRAAVLGARPDLLRAQHEQEEPDDRLRRPAWRRARPADRRRPATSSSRTTRRGCSTSSGSTTSRCGRSSPTS